MILYNIIDRSSTERSLTHNGKRERSYPKNTYRVKTTETTADYTYNGLKVVTDSKTGRVITITPTH